MELDGAFGYPVNRPLTEQEKAYRLSTQKPTRSPPLGSLSVIKMNSTYLECVDKFFHQKGFVTFWLIVYGIGILIGILWMFLGMLYMFFFKAEDMPFWGYLTCIFGVVFCSPFLFVFYLLLKWETVGLTRFDKIEKRVTTSSKGYTHYPIRFNRKNGKVYAFRLNGTVLIANWKDIYFTPVKEGRHSWTIRGHILDKNGETVLDTFALPFTASIWKENDPKPILTCFWEFVRRYMEGDDNDVKKLLPEIGRINNVSDRKETFLEGYLLKIRYYTAGAGLILFLLHIPLQFLDAIGRKIAMMCGKIPQWPPEIEAECAIEPNDPYLVDETHPPPAS